MGILIPSGDRCLVDSMLTRKTSKRVFEVTVPQTDTGRRVEYTQGVEIITVKELGKIAP